MIAIMYRYPLFVNREEHNYNGLGITDNGQTGNRISERGLYA